MRRFKIAALGVAVVIGLTACGTKTDSSVSTDVTSSQVEAAGGEEASKEAKALKDVYSEITSDVSLVSPMEPTEDFIYNYYGIDTNALEEYIFEMSEEATSAEAVIVIKCQDADMRSSIVESLDILREDKMMELENYLPDQYTIVSDSEVVESGDYVYLVISENAQDILSIIKKYV